ncbi:hypothetical protein NA57DRAFT_35887 [Rhizodiscina lignyota]|uniref:RED-like N-terminal domain-containing protein n=1 Tax=Rhizodiscina lignyota TaxID=1504668 RepID=A0A9P4IIS0_9PEZI|nr:hypothetical protein NA57DRAFT_35887 [Rhizodiscina lignyota]
MNNQQFRRLVLDTPSRPQNDAVSPPKVSTSPSSDALGSRSKSSIPMTPRTVKGASHHNDFARQLAERNATAHANKKFKSSAAPKGTRLATGYQDRTKDRNDDDADDRGKRIKALEEQVKLGQIDQQTFEKLREDITDGDVDATHLVKGLDWRLLERVRRGEDVMNGKSEQDEQQEKSTKSVDEELDELEQREVAPVAREKVVKKGEMAPPPPVAGAKRSRDAILAELKASRKAAAEAAAAAQPARPQLGSKFRRIGAEKEPRIEVDERGREVLIVVGEDGKVKRKVRKAKAEEETKTESKPLLEVDKNAKPLGIEEADLPQQVPPPKEDSDDDIFEGVGAEYDPLAALGENDEDSSDGEVADDKPSASKTTPPKEKDTESSLETKPSATRNYFSTSTSSEPIFEQPTNPLNDPAVLAALKNAASKTLGDEAATDVEDPEEAARLKRRAAMLSATDRDMEDIDMGFGSSRFGDEEAEDDGKVKLSEWKGTGASYDDEGDMEGRERGGKKRKRGPKKRKGDKDSATDVMKVIERRKGES